MRSGTSATIRFSPPPSFSAASIVRFSVRSLLGFFRLRPMLPTFQVAPKAPYVVGRRFGRRRGEHRLPARRGVREGDALVHDAGKLAAGLAQLGFCLTRKTRVRSRAVDDE